MVNNASIGGKQMRVVSQHPVWEPLSCVIGASRCHSFIFIGVVTIGELKLYLYKHRNTRRYLNLDCAGNAYKFAKGKYGLTSLTGALEHVFS